MKYLMMLATHVKQGLAYQVDAWVHAGFTFFRVLLSYLLFSMLIPEGGTLSGFTLPEMVTYSILTTAIRPLLLGSSTVNHFAVEIRTGRYMKYIVSPLSPFGAFAMSTVAGGIFPFALTALCCAVWGLLFRGVLAPIQLANLPNALSILLLSFVFMLLLNYLISCLAFRYHEIFGLLMIRDTLFELFTGALAPLEMLFGGVPAWSPLYYLVGYPVSLLLGRPGVPQATALVSMGLWTFGMALLCILVARKSRVYFEGVGA